MRAVQLARTVSITFGLLLPALAAAHPLDPLTADEIRVAAQIARTDARFASAQFASILLDEPAKADVIAWRPGTTLRTSGAAGRHDTGECVRSCRRSDRPTPRLGRSERKGVEPPVMMSEFEAAKVVLTHPEFRAALAQARRDRSRQSLLFADYCRVLRHPGACGQTHHQGRLLRPAPHDDEHVGLADRASLCGRRSARAQSAERRRRRRRADRGSRAELHRSGSGTLRAARKPTVMAQPQGAERDHGRRQRDLLGQLALPCARRRPRVGTVISVARWQDGNTLRSVLYQGYLSEMFVPYMDADYGWYSRTYFDTGEYGAGTMATPLKAGHRLPGDGGVSADDVRR